MPSLTKKLSKGFIVLIAAVQNAGLETTIDAIKRSFALIAKTSSFRAKTHEHSQI